MEENYQLRFYQEGDLENIIDLLEKSYGKWPSYEISVSKTEHFKWKWLETPYREGIVVVSTFNEKIVGCSCIRFNYIQYFGKRLKTHMSGEAAVHPEHRRKGVYSSMYKLRFETSTQQGSVLQTGITYNPLLIDTASSRGAIRFPHSIERWVYSWDPLAIDELNLVKRIGVSFLKIIQNMTKAIPITPRDVEIREIDEFDSRIDVFWEQIKDSYCFIFQKSKEYLNWRYCDPRSGNFQVLLATRDDEVIGYSVVKYSTDESKQGWIADFMVLPGSERIINSLILRSLDLLTSKDIQQVQVWLPNGGKYVDSFKSYGFVKYSQRGVIFLKYVSEGIDLDILSECPPSRISYHLGSTDVI